MFNRKKRKMFGFRIVREPKMSRNDMYDIPKVKLRLKDYNTRNEALTFNDLMYYEGAISKIVHFANQDKIYHTKGVTKYVAW